MRRGARLHRESRQLAQSAQQVFGRARRLGQRERRLTREILREHGLPPLFAAALQHDLERGEIAVVGSVVQRAVAPLVEAGGG